MIFLQILHVTKQDRHINRLGYSQIHKFKWVEKCKWYERLLRLQPIEKVWWNFQKNEVSFVSENERLFPRLIKKLQQNYVLSWRNRVPDPT